MGGSSSKDPPVVVMCGLDGAGKTTFLYNLGKRLKVEPDYSIPCIGMQLDQLVTKQLHWYAWDVNGLRLRPLYFHYYKQAAAFAFMVESNDRDRLYDARGELLTLHHDLRRTDYGADLKTAPLLVFLNKQDAPKCMDSATLFDRLGINEITGRRVLVQPTCNTTGEGFEPGLRWLSEAVRQRIPSDKYDAKAQLWRMHDIKGLLVDIPGFTYPLETISSEKFSAGPAASAAGTGAAKSESKGEEKKQ